MKTHVTTTHPEATLGEAVDLMDLYQVSSLPVVDATQHLCGIIEEEDVLRAMTLNTNKEALTAEGVERTLIAKHAAQLMVRDAMSQAVMNISQDSDARQAAYLLLTHSLNRLPVTDELGRVVGILNRIDVIQAIFEQLL